ncbi:MAG: hypothetical protein DWQ36_25335 [Acidobacteria bacterium]|nr:MAG: hypothetical protein DWQ30_25350 [Acidobacteriota bacterium]REJ99482.1 MAG: hypothetical protein DWQ36_25335 [Acidobacteriota bacterium]
MKLLLDQNLSPRLIAALVELYPGSTHVREAGLARADDLEVWRFAKVGGFTIVSKDADFHQLSFVVGHPPKVVWIRRGNCSTADIANLLRTRHPEILLFAENPEASFLALD